MEFVWKGFAVITGVLLINANSIDELQVNAVDEVVNEQISIEELFSRPNEDGEQRRRRKRFYIQEVEDDEHAEKMADIMEAKITEMPSARDVNLPWYINDVQTVNGHGIYRVYRERHNSNEKYHDY